MVHRAHHFIVEMKPSFPTAAISVWVKNIDRIVAAVCRLTVMVKHCIEPVMRCLYGSLGSGYHNIWTIKIKSRRTINLSYREKVKIVPSGISSSGANWMNFPILITPPAAASYRKRLRWRTSMGGSASMRTWWLASPKPDGPPCTDCGCDIDARASWMVFTKSGCEKTPGVSYLYI